MNFYRISCWFWFLYFLKWNRKHKDCWKLIAFAGFFGKVCQYFLHVDYEIWQRRQEGGLFSVLRIYRLSSVLNKLNLLDLKKVRSAIRSNFQLRRGEGVELMLCTWEEGGFEHWTIICTGAFENQPVTYARSLITKYICKTIPSYSHKSI